MLCEAQATNQTFPLNVGCVQKLPKGALVIVKGGDMLGNMATLEEHDVEVTFQPPEAVTSVRALPSPPPRHPLLHYYTASSLLYRTTY